jgi:uncharacterized membrane protein
MAENKRQKYIRELIKVTDKEFSDEELMHLLIANKVTVKPENSDDTRTIGQKAADSVAKFAGSWGFIFSFLGGMIVWMIVNFILAARAFDAYPYILLNLVLSCIAAIQAPLIMMSQNRQEALDRSRAENDYRVNLKNELIIDDLHIKLDTVMENQKKLLALLEKSSTQQGSPKENKK